jgi:hypothetical protein
VLVSKVPLFLVLEGLCIRLALSCDSVKVILSFTRCAQWRIIFTFSPAWIKYTVQWAGSIPMSTGKTNDQLLRTRRWEATAGSNVIAGFGELPVVGELPDQCRVVN